MGAWKRWRRATPFGLVAVLLLAATRPLGAPLPDPTSPPSPSAVLGAPDRPAGPPTSSTAGPPAGGATGLAGTGSTSDDPALAEVAREIERAIERRGWRGSRWGVLAISGVTGDTLVARDIDVPLAPASNVKILTSAASLFHLGPDFRFPTLVLSDAPVVDGTLQGDAVLYGTGDPALSDRFFESDDEPFRRLARELARQGIRRVAGDVLGDGTFFSGPVVPSTWENGHLTAAYGAPVAALSANDNLVTLRIVPAAEPGDPPEIHTEPEGAKLHLEVDATTVARAPRPLAVERPERHGPIVVRGEIHAQARDQWRRLPVTDPPLFAASLFRRALEEEGIRVDGEVRTVGPADGERVARGSVHAPAFGKTVGSRVLALHRSPPLEELLPIVNQRSNNFYAELFLKSVGRMARGEGSFEAGTAAVETYLEERAGIDGEHLRLADGSGLSRDNRATAAALLEVLQHVDRQPYAEAFWASMPIAGESRHLRRMGRTSAAGNLQAKTGTIRNVSALSGRVRTADGEPVYFSVVANDVPSSWAAKDVEDAIGGRLAGFRRQEGPVRTAGEVAEDVRVGAEGAEGTDRR